MAEQGGKTAIIGAGRIGSLCAWSLAMSGIGGSIVLVDTDRPKMHAQAADLCDASTHFQGSVRIATGGYDECADAAVALVCVGGQPSSSCPRNEHLIKMASQLNGVAENLNRCGFSGVAVLVCHPNDVLTRYFHQISGFPARKVIGAEALLYSQRLRRLLGERFQVEPDRVEAFALGECGESQAVLWSAVKVDGKPMLELMEQAPSTYGRIDLSDIAGKSRHLGWVIQDGKGREEFGIASAACVIVKAILCDSKTVLPVSASLEGAYGQQELYASAPAVIGRDGVERIVELSMNGSEQDEFAASCLALRDLYKAIFVTANRS